MSTITRAADLAYSLRFLRLLTTKWENTNAYKLGIIDINGKPLKRSRDLTRQEKTYYNMFHRLVFNIKRLLGKIPILGKSIITNYAAALLLLKEETGMSDESIRLALEKYGVDTILLKEEIVFLQEGIYRLNKNMIDEKTGEEIFKKGDEIILEDSSEYDEIFGIPVYKMKHTITNRIVRASKYDTYP